ncbi:MAG: hypothetical protein WBW16_12340 [Bacteroidota bacterium]
MPKQSKIIYLRLATADPKVTDGFPAKCWLLSACSTYRQLELYGFLAEGVTKDESLGKLFAKLEPQDGNVFDFELAVSLPDLFPNIDGKLEYFLDVLGNQGSKETIAVSNQMARIRYKRNGEDYLALLPRYKLGMTEWFKQVGIPENSPVDLLKTTVAWRTSISGISAELAIENNIEERIEQFVCLLNRFLSANLAISREDQPPYLTPAYSRSSFDFIYFILQGKVKGTFGHGRITGNLKTVMLNPEDVNSSQLLTLSKIARGEENLSASRALLYSARSFLRSGSLPYALLQMVVAAEIATTRYVHRRWIEEGVSKSKLKEYEKDVTYSQMLNIHLIALSPDNKKPDSELVGDINGARDLRNDFMHEGIFNVHREGLEKLYSSTRRYLDYIDSL